MNRVIVWSIGIVVASIGFVAAAILALLPLPTVTALGATIATCGPGASSSSALEVELDPNIVNEGGNPDPALVQICTGYADDRMTEAAVALGAGLLLGLGVPLLLQLTVGGQRPPQPPQYVVWR